MLIELDHDDLGYVDHLHLIVDWASKHGIHPDDVPMPAVIQIKDNQLTVELYKRDTQGQVVIDYDTNQAETVERTVDLVEPWPTTLTHGHRHGVRVPKPRPRRPRSTLGKVPSNTRAYSIQ